MLNNYNVPVFFLILPCHDTKVFKPLVDSCGANRKCQKMPIALNWQLFSYYSIFTEVWSNTASPWSENPPQLLCSLFITALISHAFRIILAWFCPRRINNETSHALWWSSFQLHPISVADILIYSSHLPNWVPPTAHLMTVAWNWFLQHFEYSVTCNFVNL